MSRKYLAHYLGCGRHWKRPTYGWICSKDIPSHLKHFPLVEKAGVTSTHNAALGGPANSNFKPHVTKRNPSIKFQAQLQGLLLFKHGEKPPHGAKKMRQKMKSQISFCTSLSTKIWELFFFLISNKPNNSNFGNKKEIACQK